MKKFELIRKIFAIVMRVGFNDDKQDAISEYTKDKLTNKVYVKKIVTDGIPNVDSVAVTALENDFSDACDSDLRIAFNDTNIGKRVILYANEVEYSILMKIYEYLRYTFGADEDEYAYYYVTRAWSNLMDEGEHVNLPNRELKYILNRFKEEILDKK